MPNRGDFTYLMHKYCT